MQWLEGAGHAYGVSLRENQNTIQSPKNGLRCIACAKRATSVGGGEPTQYAKATGPWNANRNTAVQNLLQYQSAPHHTYGETATGKSRHIV